MNLTPEAIDAFKTILEDPKKYEMDFEPLDQVIVPADEYFDNSKLFKVYQEYINKPLPKLIFYIIMNMKYTLGPTPEGTLGYKVKFQQPVSDAKGL